MAPLADPGCVSASACGKQLQLVGQDKHANMPFTESISKAFLSYGRKLPLPVKEFYHRLRYPGAFRIIDTPVGVSFYYHISKLLRPYTYASRVYARHLYGAGPEVRKKSLQIERRKGYAISNSKELPIDEVLTYTHKVIPQLNLSQSLASAKKPFFAAMPIQDYISLDSPFMRLALHPSLIYTITEYMGILPVLREISLFYSPNTEKVQGRSQAYHLDGSDLRNIKVFLFVEDVTHDSGPLTIIPADVSERVYYALKKRKLTQKRNQKHEDETIYPLIRKEDVYPLVGKKGTIVLVDTDRCYHFGSRPGTKPRWVLLFYYTSPFARNLPWLWKRSKTKLPFRHLVKANASNLASYVLGAR